MNIYKAVLAVLLMSTLSTYRLLASLNDVLWRHLTASNTIYNDVSRHLSTSFLTSFTNGLATLAVVRYTFFHFTFLQHLLFDSVGRLVCDASVDFTHLHSLQYTIINLEAVRRDHLSSK
jgi:hypothetical protein